MFDGVWWNKKDYPTLKNSTCPFFIIYHGPNARFRNTCQDRRPWSLGSGDSGMVYTSTCCHALPWHRQAFRKPPIMWISDIYLQRSELVARGFGARIRLPALLIAPFPALFMAYEIKPLRQAGEEASTPACRLEWIQTYTAFYSNLSSCTRRWRYTCAS
jgi:hypothetical protein